MNLQRNLNKDDEKIKFDANDILLRSKSFFIFTVNDEGDIDAICNAKNLNRSEYLGILVYMKSIADQKLIDETIITDEDETENSDDLDIKDPDVDI